MRIVIAVLLVLTLVACKTEPVIKTVYKDKYVPVLYVPQPPKITVPEYYADSLTEEQKNDIGELTKAYIISSYQQHNHIKNLEKVYNLYLGLAKSSEKRLAKLESLGENVDRSLLEQANAEIQETLRSLSEQMELENAEHNKLMLQSVNQMQE